MGENRRILNFPFPLDPDGKQLAFLFLPQDLTEQEAERLKKYIDLLVIPAADRERPNG